MIDFFSPDWGPLRKVLSEESCGNFMYMATYVTPGGKQILAYKHSLNRRYLNLDGDGRFYRFTGDDYVEITNDEALSRFAADGFPLSRAGVEIM